ncbi:ubiquitin carboxyl-terminal hydrolase 10-like [Lycium barbarum]|uniref:ubiquitin carboxyl-terminal hydrolase 10-like n=1 Tax=Lycium barbarum TaxID=112863 RepID=UPI00293ED836|nr:ubiquitin carboxyl-terminal hydrolase 10-like [Lycium barbarum]
MNWQSGGGDPQLLRFLDEGHEYVLVPKEIWENLSEWLWIHASDLPILYKGGPVLPQKIIYVGDAKQLSMEVFPLCLSLFDTRDNSHKVTWLNEMAHISDYFYKMKHNVLVASNQKLEDSN